MACLAVMNCRVSQVLGGKLASSSSQGLLVVSRASADAGAAGRCRLFAADAPSCASASATARPAAAPRRPTAAPRAQPRRRVAGRPPRQGALVWNGCRKSCANLSQMFNHVSKTCDTVTTCTLFTTCT